MITYIYIWRVLALLWSVKIFMMSTEAFASHHTRSLLAHFLETLGFAVSPDFLRLLNLSLRKSAHLFEYAVLSFLLYCSFGEQGHQTWQPRRAGWALALAAVYALTDEFHQALVRGRSASYIDSVIDATGALLAMILLYRFSTRAHLGKSATSSRL